MSGNVVAEQVKAEEDTGVLYCGSNMCSTSYLSLGVSRSRHNLNEVIYCHFAPSSLVVLVNTEFGSLSPAQAEKEAKRLRRVLANRESARRTIRRRQVRHFLSIRWGQCAFFGFGFVFCDHLCLHTLSEEVVSSDLAGLTVTIFQFTLKIHICVVL